MRKIKGIHRREFVTGAGVLAGAAALRGLGVPARAFAAAPAESAQPALAQGIRSAT